MSENNDGLNKIIKAFRKYLNDAATPIKIYKSILKTYNYLKKVPIHGEVHVEDIKIYNHPHYASMLTGFFKEKTPIELQGAAFNQIDHESILYGDPQKNSYDDNIIIAFHNAIVGIHKKNVVDFVSKRLHRVDDYIYNAITRAYGENLHDVSPTPLEVVWGTDNDDEIKGTWTIRKLEVGTDKMMKVFVRSYKNNKIVVIPRVEIEKLYLKELLPRGRKVNPKVYDEEVFLTEILRPYKDFAQLYRKPGDFVIKPYSGKSPILSLKLLNTIIREVGAKEVEEETIGFTEGQAITYRIDNQYRISNQYITIMPTFMLKTSYNPSRIIERARDVLDLEMMEKTGAIYRIKTFNHGNYYRLDKEENKNMKGLQIRHYDIGGIKIKAVIKKRILKVNQNELTKYFIKKVKQGLKK